MSNDPEASFETSQRKSGKGGSGCLWAFLIGIGVVGCIAVYGGSGGSGAGSPSTTATRSASDLMYREGTIWPTLTIEEKESVSRAGVKAALSQSIGAVSATEESMLVIQHRACMDRAAMAGTTMTIVDLSTGCSLLMASELRGR